VQNILPVIREMGVSCANAIAAKLNARSVKAARGGRWTHVQVVAVLERVSNLSARRTIEPGGFTVPHSATVAGPVCAPGQPLAAVLALS
jgi:hypothetical protein